MAEKNSGYDISPRSWLDAFPWLRSAARKSLIPWWDQAIDACDARDRRKRLANISEFAMEKLAGWTIGEIFPGLPPGLDLRSLQLPTRAINALIRRDFVAVSDLAHLKLSHVMTWPGVGVGTVDAILQVLADVSTSKATPAVKSNLHVNGSHDVRPSDDLARSTRTSSVIADLTSIASWCATVGDVDRTLLACVFSPGTPSAVLEARQRLSAIRARDVLPEDGLRRDIARLLDQTFEILDARAAAVVAARLFADRPSTLEELGQQHNVTRERIRQIEAKARGMLVSSIAANEPLAQVADAVRGVIDTILPLDELLSLIPALEMRVQATNQTAWRVLDRLDDSYEIVEGWCAVPSIGAAQSATVTQLQEHADHHGIARLEQLSLVNVSDPDRRKELTASWLRHSGYIIDGDYVLTRTASVGDYAAAILSLQGGPMTADEIVERFAFERNTRSLRNALNIDRRFERVDRDRFALAEWGMDTYTGIRSLINDHLMHSGGRIKLKDLTEAITGRYSVSETSVLAYANSPPFETKDGVVRRSGNDRKVSKTPEKTRRLFRRPDAWAYRIRITQEHLRGSGSTAPVALASILGLKFGEARDLESPHGPLRIAWNAPQPSLGSIRRFAMFHDTPANTEAFIVFHDGGTVSFEPLPDFTNDPIQDVVTMIGAQGTTDPERARKELAWAIGLPETTPVTSIIGAYRDRGDDEIADMITSIKSLFKCVQTRASDKAAVGVDEILGLL